MSEKWTQCPPVTVKVKELIGGQVCMGTYGLVELEVMQLETELAASKADRVAISQQLSDVLDALFASNKQLANARGEVERLNLERSEDAKRMAKVFNEDYERLKRVEDTIKRQDVLIEQMREALRAWTRTPNIPLLEAIKMTEAALEAAESVG